MRKTSGYTANYNSMQQIVCRHDTSFRYIYPVPETSPVHQRIKRRSDSRPARCRIDKIEIDLLSRGNLRNRWLVHDERPFLHIFFLFFLCPFIRYRSLSELDPANFCRSVDELLDLTEILWEFLITALDYYLEPWESIDIPFPIFILLKTLYYTIMLRDVFCKKWSSDCWTTYFHFCNKHFW